MKRIVKMLILCLTCILLPVCVSSAADTGGPAAATEPPAVDLDLSGLSGTVAYAQVYSILSDPEAYLGRIIKISGYYSIYEDTEYNTVYHACVIPDATACCAQGFEFVRAGEYVWPDAYPEEGTDITVTGRLATYEENGILYLHLTDAELTWDESL